MVTTRRNSAKIDQSSLNGDVTNETPTTKTVNSIETRSIKTSSERTKKSINDRSKPNITRPMRPREENNQTKKQLRKIRTQKLLKIVGTKAKAKKKFLKKRKKSPPLLLERKGQRQKRRGSRTSSSLKSSSNCLGNEVEEKDPSVTNQKENFKRTKRTNYFDDQINFINNILMNLLRRSEASSLIVCGDAGIGKKTLIKNCLASFSIFLDECFDRNSADRSHRSMNEDFKHLKISLLKFDGLIHGKNDLATIRLIGRHLRQFLIDRKGTTRKNSSKTSISSLDSEELSRTDEEDDDEDDDEDNEDNRYIESDENPFVCLDSEKINLSIPRIMSALRFLTENEKNFRSIILLNNFEIFCRKQQTLLYNLLDLTQHGRSILLIGITRRLDYLELLEKRVRSRLTQRVVHLISPFEDLEQYQDYCYERIEHFCQKNPNLRENFRLNKDRLNNDLAETFAINPNFDEINRIIAQYSFHMPTIENGGQQQLEGSFRTITTASSEMSDPKILALCRLKKNDLIILIVILKCLREQESEIFTCAELYLWSMNFALLRRIRMGLIIKSIYNLMDYDLIINETECSKKKISRHTMPCIDKWTKLIPNIGDFQLKQYLQAFDQIIPQQIKKLLN